MGQIPREKTNHKTIYFPDIEHSTIGNCLNFNVCPKGIPSEELELLGDVLK
jgi:hypothetical protein